RYGQAHRPVSLLLGLHDNVPVGRALHAPDRSCSAMDRTPLPPPLGREGAEVVARQGAVTAGAVPAGSALRGCRQAFGRIFARATGCLIRTYPRFCTRRLSNGPLAS